MAIAVLVGSLRKDSITRKVARALEPFMPSLQFEHLEIGNLPLYNQDLDDATPPPEWTAFRERLRAAMITRAASSGLPPRSALSTSSWSLGSMTRLRPSPLCR